MAEVVGVVASGAAIVGFGCQILESVFKLQRTLTAIQDAPQELKTTLEEITIVTNVLIQCLDTPNPHAIGSRQAVARDQALVHCETACKHLFAVVSGIENSIKDSKFRSRWYSVLAVLKAKRIADLVARLERVKSTLALAQIMHLQSHVAAAWLHPSLCKQLLEYGADSSVSFHSDNLFWNPLGLAVECAGYYRYHMFPGLEKYRPEPQECRGRMRETMRVLAEHGSVEAHQGYQPGEFGHWNQSRSALYWFRGTSEDFSWLIKLEKPIMTAKDWDDYIASIVLQQTEMFPNDSFPAAFNKVSNMKSLAKYKDTSGSSLLHYLLDTNFGNEPGIWLNGVDIFTFVRTLLQHGANPTARNNNAHTLLMKFAQHLRRYFMSHDLLFNAEAAIELFSGFLARWTRVLKSCKIDLGKYRSQEVESGAEIFAHCRGFEDYSSATVEPRIWFVRLVFEQIDTNQELQIKLQFKSRDKDKMMPGTWLDELADT
ncbi:uncharacterized protein A1O9_04129 [Exophiala aquamarina CBS 119918]|uniref:NACHT-NTPase and P-loop NTPases N-terminal domain-containing protein n=1 Tax=Exophiala aquamarina CBS 119918 TaxID=1182545 RepID=A0A072PUV5_9EURO|nr:uncharacterized protein A1O9_04129 [Exophiala aquamarina CBS 119918]KEF59285.1 hypothetical protein A1O9_04129 [Exophiala aquamarina CBS 119918]